jgi:hypothetical protein
MANEDKSPNDDDAFHKLLLDRLREQDDKIAALSKKNDELISFNRQLLSSGSIRPISDDVTTSKAKLEEYLKGDK